MKGAVLTEQRIWKDHRCDYSAHPTLAACIPHNMERTHKLADGMQLRSHGEES